MREDEAGCVSNEKPTMIDEARKFFRFGGVGLASTAIHAGMLAGLVELVSLRPSIATVFAFLTAFIFSYVGHYFFSFRSNRAHGAALPAFALIACTGALMNFLIFALLSDRMGVHYLPTLAVALIVVTPVIFLLSRKFSFDSGDI